MHFTKNTDIDVAQGKTQKNGHCNISSSKIFGRVQNNLKGPLTNDEKVLPPRKKLSPKNEHNLVSK